MPLLRLVGICRHTVCKKDLVGSIPAVSLQALQQDRTGTNTFLNMALIFPKKDLLNPPSNYVSLGLGAP